MPPSSVRIPTSWFVRSDSGQALLETALALPVLMTVILNSVNMGYFFLVALNVAASPRSSAEYAIMGYSTPSAASTTPAAHPANTSTTAAYLAYEDLRGALASSANAKVQVCSKNIGYTNRGSATQISNCKTCTSSSDATCTGSNTYTPAADPEAPSFVLHRVDVSYTFTPLIPGTAFNVALLPSGLCSGGTCTFHRQISMRAMD
jgi:hypothetical protein